MVLKKSKYGGRSTGNTQRSWVKSELSSFHIDRIMMKKISTDQIISKSGKSAMNIYDGNLDDKIFYSLKKKKRWTLLDSLYESSYDSPLDFTVHLEAPKTSSNVMIKVQFDEEIEDEKKKKKKIDYSLLVEDDEDKIIPKREINYIINYPVVRRRGYKQAHGWDVHQFLSPGPKYKHNGLICEEDMHDEFEDWEEKYEPEQSSCIENTYSENNFSDYILKATKVKKPNKRFKVRDLKKKSSSIILTKDHVIYENRNSHEKSRTVIEAPPRRVDEVLMIPKYIAIWEDELKEENLRINIGENYYELNCIPRRFLIRISKYLKNILGKNISSDNLKIINNIYLVFDVNQMKATSENKRSSRVYLHGNFNAESLAIETIHSHETYTIESIITHTVDYLTKIMISSLFAKEPVHIPFIPSPIDYLQAIAQDYLNVDVDVYSPEDIFIKRPHIIKSIKPSHSDSIIVTTIESPIVCNICYEVIQSDGFGNGMAILPCQHWICNCCWHNYIINQFLLAKSEIICPGHDCKYSVHIDIIRTVVSGEDFHRYMLRNSLTNLQFHGRINWCPNVECGHVAFMSKNDFQIYELPVSCFCQNKWCFECKKEAHWPATCQQFEKYANGPNTYNWKEKEGAIVEILVKNCPTCQYPIEKFQGCNYMICKCGSSFCWECLQTYDQHDGECKKENFKHEQPVELSDVKSQRYRTWKDMCDFHNESTESLKKFLHKTKKIFTITTSVCHGVIQNTDELIADCHQVIHCNQTFWDDLQIGIQTLIQVHKFCEFTEVWLHVTKFNNLSEMYIIANCLGQLQFLLIRINQHIENKTFAELPRYVKQIKRNVHKLSVKIIQKKIKRKKEEK